MTTENKPQISDEEKKKREANLKMIQKLSDLAVAGAINQHQNEWGKTINQAVKHYTLDKYYQDQSMIPADIIEATKQQIMMGQQQRGEQISVPENIPLESIVSTAAGMQGALISQLSVNELAKLAGWKNENPKYSNQILADLRKSKDEEEQEIGSNLPALYTQTLATKAAAESLSAHSKNIFKASGLEELLKKPEQAEAPVAKKPKSDDKKEVEKQQKLEKEREIALKYTKGDFTDWAYAGLIARDKDYGSQTASIARQDSIQKAKGKDLSGKLFADGLESTGIEGSVYNETFSYARAGAHAEMTFNHYIKSLKVDDVIEMAGLKNENPKYAGAHLSELLEGKDEEGKAFASTLIGVYTDYVTSKKASEALAGFVKSSTEQANKYLAKPKEEKEGGK